MTSGVWLFAIVAGLLIFTLCIFAASFLQNLIPAAICIILAGFVFYLLQAPPASSDFTEQKRREEKLLLINKELKSYIYQLKASVEKHSIV